MSPTLLSFEHRVRDIVTQVAQLSWPFAGVDTEHGANDPWHRLNRVLLGPASRLFFLASFSRRHLQATFLLSTYGTAASEEG